MDAGYSRDSFAGSGRAPAVQPPRRGDRVGRHDERPPPPPLCETCHRRFCQCVAKPPSEPHVPGAEDCCQSSPQCKFCVWIVYEENLAEYHAYLATKNDGR